MATTFAVPDGRVAMNAVLRNGFGTSGGSITSLNFQPDFFWEKARNNAYNHQLVDSVRGVSKVLNSNLTDVEGTQATYVTSFNSNGYTLGANDYGTGVTLVDWCWKAGGTAVSNTAGTITSSVSANTTAGFSVATFTSTASGDFTFGHGLGVKPAFFIVKTRGGVSNWACWHQSLSSNVTSVLILNSTAAVSNAFNIWGASGSDTTVIGVSSGAAVLTSSACVAYCWAPVAGYSAFGSYTGNGSADGPFIYTGFLPRFILIKVSSTTGNWRILDTARSPSNVESLELYPSLANAESSFAILDGLSNGFKIRNSDVNYNNSGSTYIYACFAENPLKYANAR